MLLPRRVVHEIQKEKWVERRRKFNAVLDRLFDFDDPVCREWNPLLKAVDPLLKMGRARPKAYWPGWPVIPNYYHLLRENPTAPWSVKPITAPDGKSFKEPDSALLDKLRETDLQNPRIFGALLAQQELQEKEREREERERDEERQGEIWDRFLAATRTQVLTSPDVPWSQNHKGRGGRGKQ
jgi:hypothetical protein